MSYGFYHADKNIEKLEKYEKLWEVVSIDKKEHNKTTKIAEMILDHAKGFKNDRDIESLEPNQLPYMGALGELLALYMKS